MRVSAWARLRQAHGRPHEWARDGGRLTIPAIALGATLAACVAPEVSDPFALTTDSNGVASGTWRLEALGRITADYAIANEGSSPATYTLRAQAQTSGDPIEPACEFLAATELRAIAALGASDAGAAGPDGETLAPLIGNPPDAVVVITDVDGAAAFVRFRAPAESRFEFVVQGQVPLEFFPIEGTIALVPSVEQFEPTGCAGFETRYVVALNEGDYHVRIPAGSGPVRVYFGELCTDARVVGRTCAGEAGDVIERSVPDLAPGDRVVDRLVSTELGVGDQVSAELTCSPTPCAGSLQLVFVGESLQCRSDDQCTGTRLCSEDGYCLTEGGCAAGHSAGGHGAGGHGAGGGWWLAAIGSFLAVRRRGFRTGRPVHRHARVQLGRVSAALAAVWVLAIAARPASAQQQAQVYTGIGATSSAWLGEVGRLTSPGFGLFLTQGLQLGLLGGQITVGTDYYLTRQEGPPLTRSLQTFTISAGPRVAVPIPNARLFADVEYVGAGLLTNSLTEFTGARTTAHGIGGAVAARLEVALPVYVELRFGVRSLFGLDTSATSWAFSLSLGAAGTI